MKFLISCSSISAAWLGLTLATVGAPAVTDLMVNAELEEGDDNVASGWHLGMASSVSTEKAYSGKRSIKIVDPDEEVGSDILSPSIEIAPGKRYVITLRAYLATGDAQGLGVYPRFWSADGKELVDAREKQIARPPLTEGQWVYVSHSVQVPSEAARMGVWLHTFTVATVTCYVDDVHLFVHDSEQPGVPFAWSGGEVVEEAVADGNVAVKWSQADSSGIGFELEPPGDWSSFDALSFRLHSETATGSSFMLIVSSENEATEGIDYYSFKIRLDWTGWREFVFPFRELGRSREPVGWSKVDAVRFTAAGWGNEPHPDAVLYLADFELIKGGDAGGEGPSMDDATFFANLDLDLPVLAPVREAVARADWLGAKRAFAEHIRNRETPTWRIDWRDHPFRGVNVPAVEDDRAPDQWDYYSTFITVDWQGWKTFRFEKSDFQSESYVEGEGWKGKKPIGWHWIRYLGLRSKGWGLTPDEGTTLFFDDIRLVGRDGARVVADFEGEDHPVKGLERVAERAKTGDYAGKWADISRTTSIDCHRLPHDWTSFDALEFDVYSVEPTGARFVLLLDSDPPTRSERVEGYLRKRFSRKYGSRDWAIEFKDEIDWGANPTEGEGETHLWNEALNRHFHFGDLSTAYWETGDERYVAGIVEQWMDWIRRNPRRLLSSGNGRANCAWQTLTTGIRLENIWPDTLYRCLGSKHMTDDVVTTVVKSVTDQARHLLRWPSGGNWLTEESMGLYTAGMLFPEFREAAEWRRVAVERLYRQLDDEVYPDGMEYEVAAGYNNWVVSNFSNLVDRADSCGRRDELPADFLNKIEKMYNYQLLAMMPDGRIPGLNDSGNSDVRGSLARGFSMFPRRDDFLFGSTLGGQGTVPQVTSHAFPYTGHYVMRTSWASDAVFLLFDSGPFGYGHQHEDKLHFVLYAHGRQLILDPGNYSYDHSKWRRYVLRTHGHNTVMVDGGGQCRRRDRDLRFWPRPWDTPVPPDNDTVWRTTDVADFACGTYRDGYGEKGETEVEHRRRILFVKPDYFVVQDTLIPVDTTSHRYDSLFHLDADSATVSKDNASVRTTTEGATNVVIMPVQDGNLTVGIVKGQEDPVQGWSNHPWRAVPTVVFSSEGSGTVRFAYVVVPVASAGSCPVVGVAGMPVQGAGQGITVRLADGAVDRFVFNDAVGKACDGESVSTSGHAAWVRTSADGEITARLEAK